MALADLIAQSSGRIALPDFAGAAIEGAQAGRLAGMQRLQADDERQQIQQRTLANLAAQQQQADIAAQREAMGANTTYGDDGPSLNQAGYLSQLAKSGAVPMAYNEQSRLKAAQIAAEQVKIDKAQKEIERRTQILGGIKSPMQLAAAIPEMEKMGINVEGLRALPFQRNWKEELDNLVNMGLTHKERLDQAKQSLDEQKNTLEWNKADVQQQYQRDNLGLDQQRLQETQRANKARESIDWSKSKRDVEAADKAPAGYRKTADGNLEAIPGGPADEKIMARALKLKEAATTATSFIENGMGAIDSLIEDPALGRITGAVGVLPSMPGFGAARAESKAAQIEGQAFLQGFQSLKGAGAITEMEGKKATAAIARLDRRQSTADYISALKELREIMSTAKARYQNAMGQSAPATRFYQGQEYIQTPSGTWEAK